MQTQLESTLPTLIDGVGFATFSGQQALASIMRATNQLPTPVELAPPPPQKREREKTLSRGWPAAFGLATPLFFVILSGFPETNRTKTTPCALRVAGSLDAIAWCVRIGWIEARA